MQNIKNITIVRCFLLLSIAVIFSVRLNAQTNLNFDKRFVQCEDKWVAFKPDSTGAYTYGFIYIDEQAGLTLNYEGNFTISPNGKFIPKKLDSTSLKVRLEPNNVLVAIIPESKFKELAIDTIPEWLKYYKTDTNSIQRLYKWGYMYNGWGECAKALTYLKKAQKIDSTYKGISVELAYSYNCLKEFGKAENILEKAIKSDPTNAYINKEYIFTLTKNRRIDKAIMQFNSSIEKLKDNQFNAENCYNILQYYYKQKDRKNFKIWYTKFKKFPSNNKRMKTYAELMNKDLKK